jgi:hypothetical protein
LQAEHAGFPAGLAVNHTHSSAEKQLTDMKGTLLSGRQENRISEKVYKIIR